MSKQALTNRQLEVLGFLKDVHKKTQSYPTHAEISSHFGWVSTNASREVLKALERKGWLKMRPGVSRGLVLL